MHYPDAQLMVVVLQWLQRQRNGAVASSVNRMIYACDEPCRRLKCAEVNISQRCARGEGALTPKTFTTAPDSASNAEDAKAARIHAAPRFR